MPKPQWFSGAPTTPTKTSFHTPPIHSEKLLLRVKNWARARAAVGGTGAENEDCVIETGWVFLETSNWGRRTSTSMLVRSLWPSRPPGDVPSRDSPTQETIWSPGKEIRNREIRNRTTHIVGLSDDGRIPDPCPPCLFQPAAAGAHLLLRARDHAAVARHVRHEATGGKARDARRRHIPAAAARDF